MQRQIQPFGEEQLLFISPRRNRASLSCGVDAPDLQLLPGEYGYFVEEVEVKVIKCKKL